MGGINMWHTSNRYDPRYGDADTSGSRYTVRQGDSLRSVAQTLWGDNDNHPSPCFAACDAAHFSA
jgi:hypothetical protein